MNKKLRSTLSLVALLLLILIIGGIYIFVIQGGKISDREEKLSELNKNSYDPVKLEARYEEVKRRSAVLDSILSSRKFNIPKDLSSIKFYNFVNNIVSDFSEHTEVNIEFQGQTADRDFFYYQYKLTGSGFFNEVYKLIYSIEQSKELKKVTTLNIGNLIKTDSEGIPLFLVNFDMEAQVYFSSDSRFSPEESVENNLSTGPIYDAFYPLIRNEIEPNVDDLLDVQGAKLLALIPEGAFIADTHGSTYLVWEGEQVYLGYLTKIDYENNTVSFILNKGGIIERVNLQLERAQ
ncbi:hypothetical protein LJE86_07540 [bacterium BMS3Abin03]|jgi:hypothetical protein|nr:hypothetical protein [bacterium BMS3Abin03]MCG6958705.1 hypothetical protein [bacterium BMS3Abin03]